MDVSRGNRTPNCPLGGDRYIHLTIETNADFTSFSGLFDSAVLSMNPITFVMNYLYFFILNSEGTRLESTSDLCPFYFIWA